MKKFIAFIFAALFAAVSYGGTETVDGIAWTYTIYNGEAMIGTGGYSAAIPTSTAGDIIIPSTLGGYPVTKNSYSLITKFAERLQTNKFNSTCEISLNLLELRTLSSRLIL